MPGNPLTDPNWAPDLTDQIVDFIEKIRDKTTNNAIKVARGLVFGVLGAILGIVALVLFIIMSTRGIKELFKLFMPTYRALAPSSPPRMVPRPGVWPLAIRFSLRGTRSANTASATGPPGIIFAVNGGSAFLR